MARIGGKMLSPHNLRIEWDPRNKKEIEEAKKKYQEAKLENREIVLDDGTPVMCFKPEYASLLIKSQRLDESQFEMRMFDETGDRLVMFDSRNIDEIKNASKLFEEYIKKGWRAYAIGEKGKKTQRLFKFDADAQEIHFDEKGTKERLQNFVKSFKQVQLTPKTRAG